MNKNENAQRSLHNFENSIHSRNTNRNSTLEGYTDNLAAKSVGNLVGGFSYDDETLNNSNRNENSSYNERSDYSAYDTSNYDDYENNDNFDDTEGHLEFADEDLDSLNDLVENDYTSRRKPYDHEIPYKRPEHNSYEDEYSRPTRQGSRRNDYNNSYDNGHEYSQKNRRENNFYEQEEDYIKKSFRNSSVIQDTTNLTEIEDVKNFYNDFEGDTRNRREHNRRMSKLNNEDYFNTLNTRASIDIINEKPHGRSRNRTQRNDNIRYQPDDTLKNNINYDEFNENDPYVERPRKRRNNDEHQRRENERRRLEAAEQREFEERKRRLSQKRKQDTSMQPAIRGYTGTIPTINNQRISENRNSKSYTDEYYDETREYTQRQPASENRRPASQKQSSNKKRSNDEIYRRRYEKAVQRNIITGVVGTITTLLALIAFFVVTFNYNKLKEENTVLQNDYETLKLNQPDINELQFKIDELEEINAALINGSGDSIVDNNTSTDANDNNNTENNNNAETNTPKTHVVKSGDYLSTISTQYYGNASYVDKIKEANGLTNDNIMVGQELIIP